MGIFSILAEAFRYPSPDRLNNLREGIKNLPQGPAQEALELFIEKVSHLSLYEWEELYTKTFDLNPLITPYVAYELWGESCVRGQFMAKLKDSMQESGISLAGELPDHLVPILSYLDRVSNPITELQQVLKSSLPHLYNTLVKIDPNNLYIDLVRVLKKILC